MSRLVPIVCLLSALILLGFASQTGQVWLFVGLGVLLAGTSVSELRADRRRLEQKQEQQLKEEGLRLKLATQASAFDRLTAGLQIAIFLCDRQATILNANPKARELFDFAEPAGRTLTAVTLSNDLERLVSESGRLEATQQAELGFSYPQDRVCLAEARCEPGSEEVIVSLYEITELRRLERIRQDFVANVSHELRTPLTTIRLMSETLLEKEEGSDPELRDRYLRKIVSEVDRLSSIAGDLLILSSAESNPVRKQECDIAEVVRSTVHQLERKALDKGLALSFDGPERLLIEANGAQMTQIAINLIDNAINYTLTGAVNVTLAQDAEWVDFQVSDTGIGIASEHAARIFERFYRVDKGRSRVTGGTGLGLSIVRHLVESHGGTIQVESALNVGSTFKVRLPVGSPTLDEA